jgi:L-alanine-DL-glutamate epimerase-like enolase superfamily enzyme
MLRIERVIIYPLRVPVPHELVNCPEFGDQTLQRGPTGQMDGPWFGDVTLLVACVEGGGVQGWADLSRGHDISHAAVLATKLLGLTAEDLSPRTDPIRDGKIFRGMHTAALDWAARVRGVPLSALFGPRVRDSVKTAIWSGHRTPAGAAELAVKAYAKGVRSLKLKSSLRADDAGIAAAIKAAVPGDFEVVIDPNGRWETLENAMDRAIKIAQVQGNVWLEDPLYGADLQMAKIVRETGLPLIRTAIGKAGIERTITATPRAFNIVGSWPDTLEASSEVQKRGLTFWGGSAVDTGLFDLSNIHFALTQPALTMASEMAGSQVREHSLLRSPIRVHDGFAYPPDGPGLGIDTDIDAVERYRIADPVTVSH